MKNSNKVLLVLGVVIVLSCSFCHGSREIPGTIQNLFHGKDKVYAGNKNYDVASFNSLETDSAAHITIVSGPKSRVDVTGDKDFISHLNVFSKGSVLHIELSDNWHMTGWHDAKITITTNSPLQHLTLGGSNHLEAEDLATERLTVEAGGSNYCKLSGKIDHLSLGVAGSSHVDVENLIAKDVNIHAAGSSHIALSGKASNLKIDGAGSIHVDAEKLIAEYVSVSTAGSSHIDVYAGQSLNITALGSSRINYYGHPKNITKDVLGFSDVTEGGN